jgi:hypothetical protein
MRAPSNPIVLPDWLRAYERNHRSSVGALPIAVPLCYFFSKKTIRYHRRGRWRAPRRQVSLGRRQRHRSFVRVQSDVRRGFLCNPRLIVRRFLVEA